jgi:hypothetical protein
MLPLDSCLTGIDDVFHFILIDFYSDTKGKWNCTGVKQLPESSITILGGSLRLNATYQFLVQMGNRRNVSLQATGYVLVQIKDSNRPMISIG